MTTRVDRAALTWKGFALLCFAGILVVSGILWVWWPTPPQPQSISGGPGPSGTGTGSTSGAAGGPDAGNEPAEARRGGGGGYGVPVRVLVVDPASGTVTIELCDVETTSVAVRWYATDPPSGPVVQMQTITVLGGRATIPLRESLTPTAQSMQSDGRPIGSEVGPGQAGVCP